MQWKSAYQAHGEYEKSQNTTIVQACVWGIVSALKWRNIMTRCYLTFPFKREKHYILRRKLYTELQKLGYAITNKQAKA